MSFFQSRRRSQLVSSPFAEHQLGVTLDICLATKNSISKLHPILYHTSLTSAKKEWNGLLNQEEKEYK